MTTDVDPIYLFTSSPEETQRLIAQAAMYEGNTRRMFEEAGISTGMKVLDVGSGAGDVALLAARTVGPTGSVIGVDPNPEVLATARARAAAAGLDNVTFVEGDIRTADLPCDFDAAVGRLVLMYCADPEATLRTVAGRVRRGGVVAFEEFEPALFDVDAQSMPLLARMAQLGLDACDRAGLNYTGLRMHSVFTRAGLEAPEMWGFVPLGGPAGWPGYAYLADTFATMVPLIEQFGLATAAELDIGTLPQRFEEEAIRSGHPMWCPPHVTAWARKP